MSSPTPPFDQQEILRFLNKVTDWYQNQSTGRPNSASPGDVAFINESQPIADQRLKSVSGPMPKPLGSSVLVWLVLGVHNYCAYKNSP